MAETKAVAPRWFAACPALALEWIVMTENQDRLLKLIDRLDAAVRELREAIQEGAGAERPGGHEAVEAFADETFRARDA